MTESTPGLPKKGNNNILMLLSIALIFGAAALVYFKATASDAAHDTEQVPLLLPKTEAEPELAFAPPPPPPPGAVAPAAAAAAAQKVSPPSQRKAELAPKPAAGCKKNCKGSATAALKSSLRARGAQARACYQSALRQDSQLSGSLTVSVNVNADGSLCSAKLVKNTIQNASVGSCVLARFRGGTYPAPTGGCVSINLPLNFSSK